MKVEIAGVDVELLSIDSAQMETLVRLRLGLQRVISLWCREQTEGRAPFVSPEPALVAAISAVVGMGREDHQLWPIKHCLASVLSVNCHTEEEAHLAVHNSFEEKRALERYIEKNASPQASTAEESPDRSLS